MESNGKEEKSDSEIPDGAVVFRQSHWSWMMNSLIWFGIIAIVASFDFISMGIFPIFMALVVVIPRIITWRNTRYMCTEDHLLISVGGIPGLQRKIMAELPIREISTFRIRHGFFGRTLGYGEVTFWRGDGQNVRLSYVSEYTTLVNYIDARTDLSPFEDSNPGGVPSGAEKKLDNNPDSNDGDSAPKTGG